MILTLERPGPFCPSFSHHFPFHRREKLMEHSGLMTFKAPLNHWPLFTQTELKVSFQPFSHDPLCIILKWQMT